MIDRIFTFVRHPVLGLACRLFVGGIFVYAGWSKLFDMAALADIVQNYRMMPNAWVNIFSIILPGIELVTGICLILGLGYSGSILLATGLFAMFLIAVQTALIRGLDVECGCFGTVDAEMVGAKILARDTFFFLITIPVWLTRERLFTLDSRFQHNQTKMKLPADVQADSGRS